MTNAFCVRRIIVAGSCVLWAASPVSAQHSVDAFHRSSETSLVIGVIASGDGISMRLFAPHYAEAAVAFVATAQR